MPTTTTPTPSIFAQIVLFNSLKSHGLDCIKKSIQALLNQEYYQVGQNLKIIIRDNGSNEEQENLHLLEKAFNNSKIQFVYNQHNLGFSGAHNQGISEFLKTDFDFFLVHNPDLALEAKALFELAHALNSDTALGSVCGKLYRADSDLKPSQPLLLDSAGMCLTKSLRHFDRGSNELADPDLYDRSEYVFGGTGACLLIKRDFIVDVAFKNRTLDAALFKVFPQLKADYLSRTELFDESFFAYREDADLAWRGQIRGWKCKYVSTAQAYHKRVVLPENRSLLPAELNKHSVRNRFLLQLNNYSFDMGFKTFLFGILIRNIIVLLGVICFERSSFKALIETIILLPRALAHRKETFSNRRVSKDYLQALIN